jgi:AcrR family transcriptional regulator
MSQGFLESVARPKQARSEQTLQRILDAAETLIQERGLGDASVPEIVRRAGSSVGGFYARFRDKDELLCALEERFFNQLSARVERLLDPERWRGAPAALIVRACMEELVDVAHERARLIASFLVRASRDAEQSADGLRFRQQVAARVGALAVARRDEIGHPDPALAADLAVQLAFGLVDQMVVSGGVRAAGRALSRDELVDELVRNVRAYLSIARPQEQPS